MPAACAPPDLLDQILTLDPAGRGVPVLARPGSAAAAAASLRHARRVLIVTGFAVQPDTPETDGPPGAAVLGRALRRLGAAVRYVTDAIHAPVVAAALEVLGEPAGVLVYHAGDGTASELLRRERPTHLVAIECPGRNRAGDYLNMRGESIAAWTAPLDELFLCRDHRGGRRPSTIGIGDGGNEIGMGTVRRRLVRLGGLQARIASIVSVDHVVVAGVSNWGGYGVVAALSRLAGQELLHTAELERRMVEACVAAGAFDGVTRRREPTVDGLPLGTHTAVLELLRWAARSGIIGP